MTKSKRIHKWLKIALVLLIIGVFALNAISFFFPKKRLSKEYSDGKNTFTLEIINQGKVIEAEEKAVPVEVMTVQLTSTPDVVYLPSMIEAKVDAVLSAEKGGRIVKINVDRGDTVSEEQLLLQVDDRVWQANLKQAVVAEENAARDFQRIEKLIGSGAASQSDVDQADKLRIQTASVAEEARISIEQCQVKSPIDGVINDRFIEIGEYVQPGTPLFQVIDRATVRVVLQVPEKDIYAVKVGNRMRFTIDPLPDHPFEGKVTFVAAQADSRNNAFRTEITVDNREGLLRPGMIALVEFNRGMQENMISLPMSAVLPSKGEHIVYLAKDDQAVRRRVQIEKLATENALISAGLEEGDQVIIEGNRTLSDGQHIEIIDPESAEK
ncbi:MAG: efflux RND transporter periplasmic adaptor subunit [Pontiellaceae bacterium]|nr:efflux RND transporter periplasmic adaptor subunit [Pontiellaceae bacterium]